MTMAQHVPTAPALLNGAASRRGPASGDLRLAPIALLASLVLPGLGTALKGDVRRGLGILTGFALSALMLPLGVPAIVAMFGFWLWGLVDLYDDAA